MDSRELIEQLERAEPDELATIVQGATGEDEKTLRTYLGDDVFERMWELAVDTERGRVRQAAARGTRAATPGNVVVLHGIMGSELTWSQHAGLSPTHIWLNVFRLMSGDFAKLAFDTTAGVEIKAAGILKRFYGQQILSLLADGWTVRTFAYDWRLDIDDSSDLLATQLRHWFPEQPVHLVAHSMGGLVARNFIRRHAELWRSLWDSGGNGAAGGRLVMLGTPNHGSFSIPQLLHGLNDSLRKLAIMDLRHSLQELIGVVKDFAGPYQMMPSPLIDAEFEPLYRPEAYPHVKIAPERFERARQFHHELAEIIDPDRMIYIAGYDQPTYTGIEDIGKLSILEGYKVSRLGDGTVPHSLGLLKGVPTLYVRAEHGQLPVSRTVMDALTEILQTNTATGFSTEVPSGVRGAEDDTEARKELIVRQQVEESEILQLTEPLKASVQSRGSDTAVMPVSSSERELENSLVRGFLMGGKIVEVDRPAAASTLAVTEAMGVAPNAGTIRVSFVLADIGKAVKAVPHSNDLPVDALAVGHYIGVRPTAAELALDRALSEKLGVQAGADRSELLLTSFTDRGIIRGEIGQPFFIQHPDPPADAPGGLPALLAIAGMGYPGRFGTPELTVLVRELIWALGKTARRHLATVLIGSGEGNLAVNDCVAAWVEGIRRALLQSSPDEKYRIQAVTFVELDPAKLRLIWRGFQKVAARPNLGITIELPDGAEAEQQILLEKARKQRIADLGKDDLTLFDAERGHANSENASRVTLDIDEMKYRYGAITETASVPERTVLLDPDLVREANDKIAVSGDSVEQARFGQYLLKYLVPFDLQKVLATNHPLVIIADPKAARVHWEMVSQPDPTGSNTASQSFFLGIHRGLTRQLRTQFAPPPEPPPPPSRVLKVLVVGDPAGNLPHAAEEARLVVNMFRQLENEERAYVQNRRRVVSVHITPLIGVGVATRTRVMMELLLENFDILHYCGHCDAKDAASAGFIFDEGKRLTAAELSRVDQIPKFVFCNACESGVTNDDPSFVPRYVTLAPSFAEAFFARGVQNFVCTGWPVNDRAAREFAEKFYTLALGLGDREPEPLHIAMREARTAIFQTNYGRRTWGAYQHYGNPYTRLIAKRPEPQ